MSNAVLAPFSLLKKQQSKTTQVNNCLAGFFACRDFLKKEIK